MAAEHDSRDTGQPINFNSMSASTEKLNEIEKMEVAEKGVEATTDTETQDAQALHPMIPYNNGYGDFCFGRRANRPKGDKWSNEVYTQSIWKEGSHGDAVPELGGFVRDGSFPFFKLPIEIRRKVYTLLLAPLYQHSETDSSSYICLKLVVPRYPWMGEEDPDRYDHGYEYFLQVEKEVQDLARIVRNSDKNTQGSDTLQQPVTTKQEFERQKEEHDHKYALHPPREKEYTLAHPVKVYREGTWMADELYLEWLRNLSNVSTFMRHELCSVLWTSVGIDATRNWGDSFNAVGHIRCFLNDRPAIHSSVKFLSVELKLKDSDIARVAKEDDILFFIELCQHLPSFVRLDKFRVRLELSEGTVSNYAANQSIINILQTTRTLQVARHFAAEARIMVYEHDHARDFQTWQEQIDYQKAMEEKYSKIFTEIMLPDTLRSPPPTNELSEYLESRLSTTNIPPVQCTLSPAPIA